MAIYWQYGIQRENIDIFSIFTLAGLLLDQLKLTVLPSLNGQEKTNKKKKKLVGPTMDTESSKMQIDLIFSNKPEIITKS